MPLFDVTLAFFLLMLDSIDTGTVTVDVATLIHKAQQGDREAVGTLYQAYVRSIYRYVVARVRNNADAEDITADVFIRMVKGLPSYRVTEAPFGAWLYRIAASRIADYYRAQNRYTNSEVSEALPDDFTPMEEQLLQTQSFESLRRALHELSEEHQTILILRFVDRKSHEEVAALLGKTMTAVKSAQHRALTHLTTVLGAQAKNRHYLRGSHD